MSKLPIEDAPAAAEAMKLTEKQLTAINRALLTAQLRAAEAREAELRLMLARSAAADSAEHYRITRASLAEKVGVALGETHGWDMETGEIRELRHASR